MMNVLRPARQADLPAILAIAQKSAVGIGSLAPDREQLAARIAASTHSLAHAIDSPGEESYFFVTETPDGRIVGTSGITASAGYYDRMYSYRNEIIVHTAREWQASNRIHALHLCHDLTGASLLTSFYIEPDLEDSAAPQLQSRARLLFMAEHRERFAERIAAESPGLCDEQGDSPFWDAVGGRFFNMSYPQAERLAGGRSKSFIAELMPQYPIYVPLLPEAAQMAIGQLHPVGEVPFAILLDEGFDPDTYVDVFDGGPTVEAKLASLRSVRASARASVQVVDRLDEAPSPLTRYAIVANTATEGFRAMVSSITLNHAGLTVNRAVASALDVRSGDDVRWVPLFGDIGEGA
jgi:arginine N-succinyltransferase